MEHLDASPVRVPQGSGRHQSSEGLVVSSNVAALLLLSIPPMPLPTQEARGTGAAPPEWVLLHLSGSWCCGPGRVSALPNSLWP